MELEPHISYSQASSVQRCSRQWWLRYEGGVAALPSPAMEAGKAVDDYVTQWLLGKPTDVPEGLYEDATALWDYARGLDVSLVQPRLQARLEGVGRLVIGYPDAILTDGTVVDWKRSARWNADWMTQLSVYHLLLQAMNPFVYDGPSYCRVVRVWKGRVVVVDFEAHLPAALQYLQEAWAKTQQPYHPAEPSAACGWCSVRDECKVMCALEARPRAWDGLFQALPR